MSVHVLSGFDSQIVQRFRESETRDVCWWRPEGSELVLRLDGYSPLIDPAVAGQRLHWLLEQLLEHRATPQGGGALSVSSSHPASPLVGDLGARGFVLVNDSVPGAAKICLTDLGFSRLSFARRFVQPAISLSRPRADPELTLKDRTVYELLCMAEAAGWIWEPLPSKPADRRALPPYEIGDDLVFRSSGPLLLANYLRCILDVGELSRRHGIKQIPHGQTDATYAKILDGKPWVLPAIEVWDFQ
jgi:hypothetical protein